MKSEKTLLFAAAFAAFSAGPSVAQNAATSDSALGAALDQARAAVAASPAKAIPSCADAKELETPFELTLNFADGRPALEISFQYAGCEEVGRNDYLPPYTERSYKGADGYGLTIVTNEGAAQSDVLASKGKDWIGQFGSIANATLISGSPISAGDVSVKEAAAERKGKAVLRDSAKPLYPQLKSCETADWSKTGTGAPGRDASGKPATGWEGRMGASLVLLTKTAAFYYHEDCDICAEISRCELSSGAISSVVVGHSADCGDLKKYRSEPGVVFDACTP